MLYNTDWAYLAGFIDAEGYIHCTSKQAVRIGATLTDENVLNVLCSKFGGNVKGHRKAFQNHNETWQWRVTDRATVKEILIGIFPYLILKKERAYDMMAFISEAEKTRDRNSPGRLKAVERLRPDKASNVDGL